MDDATDWYGADAATFGDRVAAAREAAGMTQKQLSKRLGIRVATLRAWEEDLSEPRANRLSMMAGLMNVSMMWLINGEGEGLSGPVDTADAVTDQTRDILTELREMRADMLARAEQMARLEKRLRATLERSAHE
ncbi:MAG: helix-turn-helix domain-containing protein [Tateyamaria sp.]|uniref:helix-turn-helix domain-containing protein n=1 Tax=Tateyamaria sp. TaxID=1929288 RepID=UPI0032A00A75